MITNISKNKINYIKYIFIAFLLFGLILSITNLLAINEYFIGGERPGLVVVNNYDYSGSINDTERKPIVDSNFMYLNELDKKLKQKESIEYNLKRTNVKLE